MWDLSIYQNLRLIIVRGQGEQRTLEKAHFETLAPWVSLLCFFSSLHFFEEIGVKPLDNQPELHSPHKDHKKVGGSLLYMTTVDF